MELQTKVKILPGEPKIHYGDRILLIGSCFTGNIGKRLEAGGFEVRMNPFGILYNPISIVRCLDMCRKGEELCGNELVERNHRWYSWWHHSDFSGDTREECLERCNRAIRETCAYMQGGVTVIVTLGTAWVYELENGEAVGNCHKMPAGMFRKRLLGIDEIVNAFQGGKFTPEDKIIFTLSPIRHWSEGAHQNQLSKATLLLAIEKILEERGSYFPAWEIMMDELRDYRFYEKDMLHPSEVATDLIWERFQEAYLEKDTCGKLRKYEQLYFMEHHQPRFPQDEENSKLQKKIQQLKKELNT